MSRCYPYPPPGYQKKVQSVDLSVSAEKEKLRTKEKDKVKKRDSDKDKDKMEKKDREKKEKDRDKEKKERSKDKEKKDRRDKDKEKKDRRDKDKESKRDKRKRDAEANGSSHDDKDSRSKKLHRTDVLHSTEENGNVGECKTTAAAIARPDERDSKDAAKLSAGDGDRRPRPSVYSKEERQRNGKVVHPLPPAVLPKLPGTASRPGVKVEEVSVKTTVKVESAACKPVVKVEGIAPCSAGGQVDDEASRKATVMLEDKPSNQSQHSNSNNSGSHRPSRIPDFSVCDEIPGNDSWSVVDDEEWLTPASRQAPRDPTVGTEERTAQQVWENVVLLKALDMYALPYVVPY